MSLCLWQLRATLTLAPCFQIRGGNGFICRAVEQQTKTGEWKNKKKRVLVVGSGWAGLGAAHHLCKLGYNVTVLEGGYELGPKNKSLSPDDLGLHGFWYPYRNIFSLVDELGIKPFTNWTKSSLYSGNGLEVEFPIFQELPQLPSPFGTFFYTQFLRLPVADRLASLLIMASVIDFDNTNTAWQKYDPVTARELFKQYGCSEKLYRDVLYPMLKVGLFSPPEQCSAAATLGMLFYFILAHQKNFDVAWCRGTVREKIFEPWMDSMREQGCKFLEGRIVTGFLFDEETGGILEVSCGKESFKADAIILAVGISSLLEIIHNSAVLCKTEEFRKVLNLSSSDLLTIKLHLDKKVNVPNASNVCSGFDDSSTVWTFFDLNMIFDEHKNDPGTTIHADFYHASELMPLTDDHLVEKLMSSLSKLIKDFENIDVVDKEIGRFPKSLTHYFPGSYKYMMRGSTSFTNLFLAGDWVVNRHGSWWQEKSYVTGLEAANRVVDYFEEGTFAKIIPVEEDEPHIQALRNLNRSFNEISAQLPWSEFFLR